MSNASLKEQLQSVASQFSDVMKTDGKDTKKKAQQSKKITNSSLKPAHLAKSKPKWLDYVQYGVALLRAYFPACFKRGNDICPLKKGIKQDLVKRLSTLEIVMEDKACMVKSLSYYVNTLAYHKNVVEGVNRIDLDGQSVECVTAEEATYSLARYQTKLQAKQLGSAAIKRDIETE